jgi:hypothetical protein
LIVCPTTVVTISLNVTATLVAAMHAELVVDIEVMRVVVLLLVLDATVVALVLLEDTATEDEDDDDPPAPTIAISAQVKIYLARLKRIPPQTQQRMITRIIWDLTFFVTV